MNTNKKTKWKIIDREVTDFRLPNKASLHLVITDQMFQRVVKFAKTDEGVSFYVSKIIEGCVLILRKFTQHNYNWKVFQHLKPQTENETKPEVVMIKHNSKTKVRKHEDHHVLVQVSYQVYNELKNNHARINSFSMSLLARIILELFLKIYEECSSYDTALAKFQKIIWALYKSTDFEKCELKFKIYNEVDENDEATSRFVVFFVMNLKSKKFGFDLDFKLRL